MEGKELKQRIKELHLTSRQIAAEMGVTEQAMTSFYKASSVRNDTLQKFDKAIENLTKGKYNLLPTQQNEEAEQTASLYDQQEALNYAARQVATMTSRLTDALNRVEAREDALDKKEASLDALSAKMDRIISLLLKVLPQDYPGCEAFIGNIDMAAEDSPKSK